MESVVFDISLVAQHNGVQWNIQQLWRRSVVGRYDSVAMCHQRAFPV